MPCYHPLQVWQRGSERVKFRRPADTTGYKEFKVPCGQCIGCQLEKSRQWAVRCVHEASLYKDNCFLTLTYDDEHLPSDGSLNHTDMTLFLKRLRESIKPDKVRYMYCGEYGENTSRAHYHCLCFGYWPKDARAFKRSASGSMLFRSDSLDRLWHNGYVLIGDVSFESAAYVARYTMKKQQPEKKIVTLDTPSGKVSTISSAYPDKLPPFVCASNRPGIGAAWIKRYLQEVITDEYRIRSFSGSHMHLSGIPRYYRKILERDYPDVFKQYKEKIDELILQYESDPDNNWRRLLVKKDLLLYRWREQSRDELS